MGDKETRLKLFKTTQKVVNETGAKILLSEAPTDPKEKEEWAHQMMRIQVAMWVDEGAKCAHCEYQYQSVDDFLERKVREGYSPDRFVCDACWEVYKAKHSK